MIHSNRSTRDLLPWLLVVVLFVIPLEGAQAQDTGEESWEDTLPPGPTDPAELEAFLDDTRLLGSHLAVAHLEFAGVEVLEARTSQGTEVREFSS